MKIDKLKVKHVRRWQCHVFVCIFMFLYLWFFREPNYFNLPTPTHQRFTYYIQFFLPLKLVGLAFEVKDATLKCRKASKEEYEQIPYHEKELAEITLKNIFGYCFNYVSVFSGPYFTYRTYRDSFVEKYSSDEKLAEACDSNTVETFKSIVIVIVLYVLLSYLWPPRRIFEDEFYTDQSFIFRLWYMCLVCFINRMKLYFGLIVSQCVCSAAGVGAYPSVFQSTPGQGPRTKDPQLLENWDGTYDFNTIKNCDIYTVETCWTFQELAKCWHMSIQYWLYVNVYKRVPNRKLRVGVTFLVSAYCHGIDPGNYFTIAISILYITIENLCLERLRSSFPNVSFWLKGCMWTFKNFALSYMFISGHLLTLPRIWKYYNSVFHFGFIFFICQYALALFWPKISIMIFERRERENKEKINETS
ncbi:lysophospholipid acyltransferase 7-like [Phlebotomus papatasi]|uniref:lysophospholipid acyltransferase 7-like n=1 Tax=Phlebotomus papatasi TaxID=29031 RepID=UPI0024843056|nr:lysophospholipid acyltransferase 7-like [Phlebotomus papatasi]